MAAGLCLLSLSLMWTVYADGLRIGWVEGRGPGAGMWPFWLSLAMAGAAFWTLIRALRHQTPESQSRAPYIDPASFELVVTSFVALTVMLILIGIVGTYIAIALFMAFYMRVVGKHAWGLTLAMSLGSVVFIYFLFEWQLSKYLPKGWPMFEEGFLWIDNYRWEYLM